MSRIWTRRGFWLGGGALAAAATAFAFSPRAMAFHRGLGASFGPVGHHHGFGRFSGGAEGLRDKANFATDWLLRTVDGTDAQKDAARRIGERLATEMQPLAERHRALHEALLQEFGKPEIDKAAVERLRTEGVTLADDASRVALSAVTGFADVLTPVQRGELLQWANRMHEH